MFPRVRACGLETRLPGGDAGECVPSCGFPKTIKRLAQGNVGKAATINKAFFQGKMIKNKKKKLPALTADTCTPTAGNRPLAVQEAHCSVSKGTHNSALHDRGLHVPVAHGRRSPPPWSQQTRGGRARPEEGPCPSSGLSTALTTSIFFWRSLVSSKSDVIFGVYRSGRVF